MPNTSPAIDTRAQIEFLLNNSKTFLTQILPIGAVSKNTDGKDLAEIYEMQLAGAYAFSDGIHIIQHSGLMERALLYVKRFDGLIMNFPHDNEVARNGQMNEGIMSTQLGLHAAPKLAEELMVARDIYLLEHTGSRLHFNALSTAQSVELVKKAKASKLRLSASVNVANLLFEDTTLEDFDTNYKVLPHLRNIEDLKALKKGLKNGTIYTISSGHLPLHQDEKKVEFDNAYFGMSTLEFAFAMARTATQKDLEEDVLIEKLAINPYKVLGLEVPKIEEGAKASLSVFGLNEKVKISRENLVSKGKNTPLFDAELLGKVYGIIQNNKTNIL
jgi:dihydroorotase